MVEAGWTVTRDAWIQDRGDGKPGAIELWCRRQGEFVAIECDGATPRDRTLMKLRRVDKDASRILVLRTATVAPQLEGIRTIALGWPGNSAEVARATPQAARASVGAEAWHALNTANPVSGPAHMDAASVRRVFQRMREQVERLAGASGFGAESDISPLAEFDRAFGSVEYLRHEAFEMADGTLLVLASADPYATQTGLKAYAVRLAGELRETFGGTVQVKVVGLDSG